MKIEFGQRYKKAWSMEHGAESGERRAESRG